MVEGVCTEPDVKHQMDYSVSGVPETKKSTDLVYPGAAVSGPMAGGVQVKFPV
jgi:hypothetical protein